jgi:hypothetical protein
MYPGRESRSSEVMSDSMSREFRRAVKMQRETKLLEDTTLDAAIEASLVTELTEFFFSAGERASEPPIQNQDLGGRKRLFTH